MKLAVSIFYALFASVAAYSAIQEPISGKDSLEKQKKNFSFHGDATVRYFYQNQAYYGQVGPLHRYELILNPRFEYKGIPFGLSLFLPSTDKNQNYNLRSIKFSFDSRQFINMLQKRLADSLNMNYGKIDSLNTRFNMDIDAKNRFNSEIGEIDSLLNLPEYCDSLEYDTSFSKERKRIEEERRKLEERRAYLIGLEREMNERIAYMKGLKDKGYLDRSLNMEGIRKTKPTDLSRLRYAGKFEKLLLGVKNFEIGNVSPSYGELFIQGVNISGINLAYQWNKIFVAAFGGLNNFVYQFNYNPQTLTERKWTYGGQIGLGDEEKTYFRIGMLQSSTRKKAFGHPEETPDILNYTKNTVLHGMLGFKVFKKNSLLFEHSRSVTEPFSFVRHEKESPSNELIGNSFSYNDGHSATVATFKTGIIPKGEVTYKAGIYGYNFFTSGNPYLRNDLFRQQLIYKQKISRSISVGGEYLRDEDNISGIKAYSTLRESYKGNIKYSPSGKWPTVNVSYLETTLKQKGSEKEQIEGSKSMYRYRNYMLTLNKSWKTKALNLSSVLNIARQSVVFAMGSDMISYLGTFVQTIAFKKTVVTANVNYFLRTQEIFEQQYSVSSGVFFPIKKKIRVGLQGGYGNNSRLGDKYDAKISADYSPWKKTILRLTGMGLINKTKIVTYNPPPMYSVQISITQLW